MKIRVCLVEKSTSVHTTHFGVWCCPSQLELVTELRPVLLDRAAQEGESFTRYGEAEQSMLRVVRVSLWYWVLEGGYGIA